MSKWVENSSSELTHYGVKGMKWGVRKEEQTRARFRVGGPKIDPALHSVTKTSAQEVASLIEERYGFRIREVIAIGPGHPEYDAGTLGYVNIDGKQKSEGDIHVSQDDPRKQLKASERAGWVGKGCGTTEAFLTHESAHAIFHAPQKMEKGKVVGGNMDARTKALKAAVEESKREGIPEHKFMSKISGYAVSAGNREEVEAELFSQYHWGTKTPNFVKVWGETLHRELGIDDTPFREKR